jgi:hypothetical protein
MGAIHEVRDSKSRTQPAASQAFRQVARHAAQISLKTMEPMATAGAAR